MPIPKRKAGEQRDEFINRCIAEMNVLEESNTQEQNVAICYAQLHSSFYEEELRMYGKPNKGEKDAL